MTDRILDLAETPARLRARNRLLVLERDEAEPLTIPFEDLAVLIVSQTQVTYSHAVLAGITAAGGAFVACDERHLPVGMLLPIDAHYVQAERFARQAAASKPTRKRLWRDLVRAKVLAQARTLALLRGEDAGLGALAARVRSGDPANVEAQAARRYWPRLFDDPRWRRDRAAEDQNRHLNYGYAVLRAVVARSICGAGLHPSLGLHHHNRYNAFCLADDLMEPLRPLVDLVVARWVAERDPRAPFDGPTRAALVGAVAGRYEAEGESRTLFDWCARTSASLAKIYLGEAATLAIPELGHAA